MQSDRGVAADATRSQLASRHFVRDDLTARAETSSRSATTKPRVLVLHNGPAPLHHEPSLNPFHFLGRFLSGGAVYGCWVSDPRERKELVTSVARAMGDFEYVPVATTAIRPSALRPVIALQRLYSAALRYATQPASQPIAAVIVYSPYWVGLVAAMVAKRLRVPLIVQVPTDMRAAFHAQPGSLIALKRTVAQRVARYVLHSAAAWNLYFEGQTNGIEPQQGQLVSYFPDFSPVSNVPVASSSNNEFLVMGFPWSVKGVDVAIRAFLAAGDALSDWRLRIVGHCDDRSPYEALAGGDRRIIMQGPVQHAEALRLISSCGVFVLSSRTEGIARVAVEAMAAGRPVISTRVGGMPLFVKHEQTGILVEPEDVAGLSAAMKTLAGSPSLRSTLGGEARAWVLSSHSEEEWAHKLASIVHSLSTHHSRVLAA